MGHDPLGERMKAHEAAHRQTLDPGTFMLVRVDGRAFHTYCRGLRRPFDHELAAAMDATAVALCQDTAGALGAYVQSDEITVISSDLAGAASQLHFGGRVQKVASVAASVATAAFNHAHRHPQGRGPALFDARVFAIDDVTEVHNNLVWRQADARRNAISMICQSRYSPRQLQGVSTAQRRELLRRDGVDLAGFEPGLLQGRVVRRVLRVGDVTWVDAAGQEHVAEAVERRRWEVEPAEDFVVGSRQRGAWIARQLEQQRRDRAG